MNRTRPVLFSLALLTCATLPLAAQRSTPQDDASWLDNCRRDGYNGDRERACEVRDVPVRLGGRTIDVDGRENGSIRVMGWDGDQVKVTARIQTWARREDTARSMLAAVKVTSDGRRVSASGPSRGDDDENWSVSYVVMVPHRFDLGLDAHNGSVSIMDVAGKIDARTENGSVTLDNVNGDVRAHTQNGSLRVALSGSRWDGAGLDAETTNGSVRLAVPDNYAATVETGTVNGRISTDFPVTLSGRIDRHMHLPLNGGGVTLRAMTTNGSVTVSRR